MAKRGKRKATTKGAAKGKLDAKVKKLLDKLASANEETQIALKKALAALGYKVADAEDSDDKDKKKGQKKGKKKDDDDDCCCDDDDDCDCDCDDC